MHDTGDRPAREGFTLVELLIGVAVLAILLTMAATTFKTLNEKYRVETEIKQMYADLMEARARATQRNRVHFVRLSGAGYATYEDTNPGPDGNGALETASDRMAANRNGLHAIVTDLPVSPSTFEFDRNGICNSTGTIRLSSTALPDYDCITVRPTMLKMGKFAGGVCVEK